MGLYRNNNGTTELIAGKGSDTSKSIADIEETLIASKAYDIGDYIYVRATGIMYKVTAIISSSDDLIVGTNISKTTIGDELKAIQNNLADILARL